MRHGTQEELDAAKDDATRLPFGALFKTKYEELFGSGKFPSGEIVKRGHEDADYDEDFSVAFSLKDGSDYCYVSASDLEVIK